nr:MAG TPA: hypothetical protein [Caudoviricetes sp.]
MYKGTRTPQFLKFLPKLGPSLLGLPEPSHRRFFKPFLSLLLSLLSLFSGVG